MRLPRLGSILAAAAAVTLLATPSSAYYHYIHFLTAKAPWVPVRDAFDLNALPNRTLTFLVSDAGLAAYGPNDSFASVLSQVKQAAAAWNSVASSDLRIAFGGLESYNESAVSATPAGDIVFAELPPGVLGLGSPTVAPDATVQTGPNGQFLPISRGVVILTNSTDPKSTYGPGPSYLEAFYVTAVHEFGHALGMQHTWTASAMSQDVVRNTSRARPLDADDIAALCELYGSADWRASTGAISGRVTARDSGWNMASVVAIPPLGPAVSTLTNPDGSYLIEGLAPGQYLLYVHPLPTNSVQVNDRGLVLPLDGQGRVFMPTTGYFQTVFYPATVDVTQATAFTVNAGQTLTDKNFAVEPRNSVPIYDVVTYNYLNPVDRTYTYDSQKQPVDQLWLTPAYGSTDQAYLRVFAQANSLPTTPTPYAATLLGPGVGMATPGKGLQMFQGYILMDFLNQGGIAPGPRHLVLSFSTSQGPDIYVLPEAVTVVKNGPPRIDNVIANSDNTVTVTGLGLTPDTRLFFDGMQATVTAAVPAAADVRASNSITVIPPQGGSGQTATVIAYTADNQNSMFLQAATPVTFAYPPANAGQVVSVYPTALPAGFNAAGTAAMIDITTSNTNFVDGQVTVGFGNPDIQIRRVWVLGPTHLVVDVVVVNNARVGTSPVNVISGFQTVSKPAAFQIQPPNAALPTPALPVFNALNYATVLHGSDYASIFGANLAISPNSSQVLLNGTAVPVLYGSTSQINFQIPASFPSGPATLTVNNGAVSAFPIFVQIDSPPAVISVPPPGDPAMAGSVPAVQVTNPGDIVTLQVTNVDPAVVNAPNRVQVTMSGVPMTVVGVSAVSPTVLQIQFAVTQSFGGWQVPLVVTVDGSPSLALQVVGR